MYIVSVFFTQIIAELSDDSAHIDSIRYWYGRLPRAFLTMFEVVAGGVSWDEVVTPLILDIGPPVGIIFCFYVAFCVFAMLNMATGVFVDRAIRKAQEDTDSKMANHISDVFFRDLLLKDDITYPDFEAKMDTTEMQEYFRSINVDPSEAKKLFELIDTDGSESINAEELVQGCLRLRGAAKALDLQVLFHMNCKMNQQLLEGQAILGQEIAKVAEHKEKKGAKPRRETLEMV
mmetsp:Transcript_147251/g.267679  ORF Transcript_147251/g.267679 Transcript_147251/m.267679 type:complete len:233 (+) Transcript_147251:2-700(+)